MKSYFFTLKLHPLLATLCNNFDKKTAMTIIISNATIIRFFKFDDDDGFVSCFFVSTSVLLLLLLLLLANGVEGDVDLNVADFFNVCMKSSSVLYSVP